VIQAIFVLPPIFFGILLGFMSKRNAAIVWLAALATLLFVARQIFFPGFGSYMPGPGNDAPLIAMIAMFVGVPISLLSWCVTYAWKRARAGSKRELEAAE
jgi:hypothetical protein